MLGDVEESEVCVRVQRRGIGPVHDAGAQSVRNLAEVHHHRLCAEGREDLCFQSRRRAELPVLQVCEARQGRSGTK